MVILSVIRELDSQYNFVYTIYGYIPELNKTCTIHQRHTNFKSSENKMYKYVVVNIKKSPFFFKDYSILGGVEDFYYFLDEPTRTQVEMSLKRNKKEAKNDKQAR